MQDVSLAIAERGEHVGFNVTRRGHVRAQRRRTRRRQRHVRGHPAARETLVEAAYTRG